LPSQFTHTFDLSSASPFCMHTLSYTLPETAEQCKERCVYIVEVSGDEYRSRVLCVLDEDGHAIDSACVIMDGQTFGCVGCSEPSLPQVIPFVTTRNALVLTVKDCMSSEFGENKRVTVQKEMYTLACHAVVPQESLGGSTKAVPIALVGNVVLNGGDMISLSQVS
ncbi:hypothetical protein ADUPG1_001656, partial [Aduncisulcus paluster]